MTKIEHFIDGARVPGNSGRTATGLQSRHRPESDAVSLASVDEVNAAVDECASRVSGLGRDAAAARARASSIASCAPRRPARRLAAVITAEHGKMLSDAKGEIQRGLEVVEFATGAPQLLKGEVTENVGTRRRQLLAAPAAGRRRGHHAVQLSRPWCRCGCFRSRWPAATASSSSRPSAIRRVAAAGRMAQGSRPAGWRLQRRARRQGGGGRAAAPSRCQAVSFVGSTPIARYIYETGTRTASACRRWAGRRTT